MSAPALPAFTFLHGPAGVGKSTLARLLADLVPDPNRVAIYHHAEPLYWTATTFLEPSRIDTSSPEAGEWKKKKFDNGLTGRDILIELGHLFRKARPTILGDLACEFIHEDASYGFVKHFIFEAVRVPEDVEPIYAAFPSHSALFITLRRPNHTFSSDLGGYFTPVGQFCTDIHIEEGHLEWAVSILRPALAQAAAMGKGI